VAESGHARPLFYRETLFFYFYFFVVRSIKRLTISAEPSARSAERAGLDHAS
jgi:hypothetical protein